MFMLILVSFHSLKMLLRQWIMEELLDYGGAIA